MDEYVSPILIDSQEVENGDVGRGVPVAAFILVAGVTVAAIYFIVGGAAGWLAAAGTVTVVA